MKKLVSVLLFLSFTCPVWSQKSTFGIGVSAYKHPNDGYGYSFNQFSRAFWSGYLNPRGVLYMLGNFHLFYEYKIDSTCSVKLANDLFVHEHRNQNDFRPSELGLEGRVFSTTTLLLNRKLVSKWKNALKLSGTVGLAFRNGDEFFFNGRINNENFTYTVQLRDLGYVLGGEARYNINKRFFVNANLNFIDYVIGIKQRQRVSIYNKSWTVFQANFAVGVNF